MVARLLFLLAAVVAACAPRNGSGTASLIPCKTGGQRRLPESNRWKVPDRLAQPCGSLPDDDPRPLFASIENARFTWRADALRETPAAVRFISAEPLLGSLYPALCGVDGCRLNAGHAGKHYPLDERAPGTRRALDLTDIDWLIAGGESGRGHRPIDGRWVRELRDACDANGTAFFFKQWGGKTPKAGGRHLDGREWSDYPESRAREPEAMPTRKGTGS